VENRHSIKEATAKRAAPKPNLLAGGNSQVKQIASGVMHEVPADLQHVLTSDPDLLAKWNRLTPIQRNEWICWVTIVKKPETRDKHIDRMSSEVKAGKRQPCCWPGCPHRRPKANKWFRNQ